MRRLLVGVDAGGTHTTAACTDGDTTMLYEGAAANPNVIGVAASVNEIARCIRCVLAGKDADVIVAGVAGVGNPPRRAEVEARLQERFPVSRLRVCTDAAIALRAVIPHGDGIVVIAGTGSIVYAEISGEALRAGGAGFRTGDPGSAYAIGSMALSRSPGPGIHGGDASEAMQVADIAAHARVVLRDAAQGDATAAAIVDAAANELYRMIGKVALRCPRHTPLAFAGGLLGEDSPLAQRLQRRIVDGPLTLRLLAARAQPYAGALLYAERMRAT